MYVVYTGHLIAASRNSRPGLGLDLYFHPATLKPGGFSGVAGATLPAAVDPQLGPYTEDVGMNGSFIILSMHLS